MGAVWLMGAPGFAIDYSLRTEDFGSDTRGELRAASLLYELERDGITEGQRVLAAAQADYARLLAAMYDRGYYAPDIRITLDGREAADISALDAPAQVNRVIATIEAGQKFVFGRARIAPLAPNTVLPEGFVTGERARASVLRDVSRSAIEGWRAVGHPRADIGAQSLTAQHGAGRLDADIAVDPGPQLRFGPLRITGESNVRTERIIAIAGLREGRVFDPEALQDAEARLQRTGTFRAAALRETDDTVQGDRMPIEAQIADMKPRRFGFGAELYSRRGLTLSGFWLHRNLLGGAERLRFEAEVGGLGGQDSGIDGKLRLRFDRPATFDARMDFYAEALAERLDEPKFRTDRFLVEAGLSYRRDRRRTFTGGISLEQARTKDDLGTREYTLLRFPLSAEYEGRENPLNPQNGWYGRAELTPFAGLSGVGSGARAHLDLRGYRALSEGTVLALRGQVGSLLGAEIEDSPADLLFFSGGSDTVRGHSYQSLGVTLPGGADTGGRSFLGLTAEVRQTVFGNFSVVGFAEAGYIGEETFPNGTDGTWHSGAGLGLRYDTGIGPIRLDLAGPTSGKGDGLQIYIGIGQAF